MEMTVKSKGTNGITSSYDIIWETGRSEHSGGNHWPYSLKYADATNQGFNSIPQAHPPKKAQ